MFSKWLVRSIVLLAVLTFAVSCGGGGSSGGGKGNNTVSGTGFGFFDKFGNTTAPPSADDFPQIWGVNLPIILYFNEAIRPETCSNLSINLVTIDDPFGQAGYGAGHSATVDYLVVNETQLWIKPRIFFSPTQVSFGFLPDALYEIKFQTPPSAHVVTSVSGRTISLPASSKPIAFRTPALDDPDGYIYDEYPGPPHPFRFTLSNEQGTEVAYYDNDPDGLNYGQWVDSSTAQPLAGAPVMDPMKPPKVRINFSEPVDPKTVVNFADKSSPSCEVFYNHDGPWDPVGALGNWELTQRVNQSGEIESFIEYSCELLALKASPAPPADPVQYFLRVKGTVDDLAGNRKGYAVWDETYFVTDESTELLPALVEEFDNNAYEDPSITSATWGVALSGDENVLIPGTGGGTGADGEFLPPDSVPGNAIVDPVELTVELPTQSGGQPRIYNFTSVTVPGGWTVHPRDTGPGYPLVIRSTGSINVIGTIDVSPVNDSHNGVNGFYGALGGTNGGNAFNGGGAGGKGGGVILGVQTPFFSTPGYTDFFQNYGITGTNSEIFDYALRDDTKPAGFFTLIDNLLAGGTEVFLQPNVGMGPGNENVVTNHPTFVVSGTDAANNEIQITTDRGSMLDTSSNPGIPLPPIAKAGDAYLIGELAGHDGEDPLPFNREGKGSEPLTVAQTSITFASAGGGGGGGSMADGVEGETGPDFEPVGYSIGGFSTPHSVGGAGGGGFDLSGPCQKNDNVTLFVGAGTLPAINFAGYRVNPNSEEEGWLFNIESANPGAGTITIEPFSNGLAATPFDLDSVDFNGDEIFRIFPSENTGGAGGGGAGVELTGTIKMMQGPPYEIPGWLPGAGGGAGGGVLKLETARDITLSPSGKILAQGGNGGYIQNYDMNIPGGGGGGGGQILLRARDNIKLGGGAIVSAEGGVGGGLYVYGGPGGDGFVRLENIMGSLKIANFVSTVFPTPTVMNLGIFPAQEGSSLALSKFYFMGISRPDYIHDPANPDPDFRGLKVVYDMRETIEGGGDTFYENLVYPDPSGLFPDPPLFTIDFNVAPADDDGFIDLAEVTQVFTDYDGFDTLDGKPYIRFKMQLESSRVIDNGGTDYTYSSLKVRSISIMRAQQ